MDDDTCPESKITPALSQNPSMGMPITPVILDEVQVFLENPARQLVGGTKTTLGAHIADLLTYLAKKGPAAGIVVILATQRPDSTTIPSRLRAVLGSRFALRVMDWRDSNIILGEQMNTRGYDSSTLLPGHKGVGILRPDGDTEAGADQLALTVRTYYMPNSEWRDVCARGRALRQAAGTLTGHAVGDHATRAIDPATVLKALGSPATVDDPVDLPEPLASVVRHLGEEIEQREFVPTAELVDALAVEATGFGRQMGEWGCQPTRRRTEQDDGSIRQVRGYLTADIRAAVQDCRSRPEDAT
jgi:S-DNA-T family DNA segregation ATPase FtsK/SpoIIIE